jgi:hypothetical protein
VVQSDTDLAVELREDRPGTLARACEAVAQAGANVEGYAEIEGILHLVSADPAAARRGLESAGFGVRQQEVLLVALHHQPGELAGTLRALAAAGVSVRFSYLASGLRAVFGVDDLAKARGALGR